MKNEQQINSLILTGLSEPEGSVQYYHTDN